LITLTANLRCLLAFDFTEDMFFADSETFSKHLEGKSKDIKSRLSKLFSTLSDRTPARADSLVKEMQSRISKLLATEKVHLSELETARVEKEELEERLEDASLRYMVAEKKLDRAKHQTVAQMEKGWINGTGEGSSKTKKEDSEPVNGVHDPDEMDLDAVIAGKEAQAASLKQAEHVDKLQEETKALTEKLTAATVKNSRITDAEVQKIDAFKNLLNQHIDVIDRINHLEAKNVELREEAEKLQAERSSHKLKLENESKTFTLELESQLARAESDLTRIRTGRDENLAEIAKLKSAQDEKRGSEALQKEYNSGQADRILALESERSRLLMQIGSTTETSNIELNLDEIDLDELKVKYEKLDREYRMLSNELPQMQAAYMKTQKVANKKITDLTELEERCSRLQAEKSKAEQKFFDAMKARDARDNQNRILKSQNQKSADIISQLKELESAKALMVVNLEKQVVELKSVHTTQSMEHRKLELKLKEHANATQTLRGQVDELTSLLREKDSSNSELSKTCRQLETEKEKLSIRVDETKKSLEAWKGRSSENEEYESLRVSRVQVSAKQVTDCITESRSL
jgi:E3 ubiquitin-protein ligase BRE1